MKELVKIQDHEGIPTVNAREIHEFLESKQDFSTWIKSRIEKYGFVEKRDFVKLHKKKELSATGQKSIEYFLSVDMAKSLGMVENNIKGQQIREYFIAVEEAFKNGKFDKKRLRDKSKEVRLKFTDTLKEHGYKSPHEYIQTTKQMKEGLGIDGKKKKAECDDIEVMKIQTAEMLARTKIMIENANGYKTVNPLCVESSKIINQNTQRQLSN